MPGLAWLVGAFVSGCAIGGAYFIALWMTVRALPTTKHPGWLMLGSFVLRFVFAGVTLLFVVQAGGWAAIVAALAGFVLARGFIVRRLLSPDQAPAASTR